jgi:hypothetical protein
MNLVTGDAAGVFLIPLGASLNIAAWDTFNSLGLVYLPFLYLYISSWAKAHTQGADEGSSGILLIKYLEKGFYGYLFLIMIFCLPIGNEQKVSYRQFSCLDNPSISSNALKDINTASAGVLNALNLGNDSLPVGVGFLHNTFNGMNGALISKMACTKGASKSEVSKVLKDALPKTESVYQSIMEFDQQCFSIAKNNLKEAIGKKDAIKPNVNYGDQTGWTFYPRYTSSPVITQVYENLYLNSPQTINSMQMEVTNNWFNSSVRGTTQKCSDMAESLYEKIEEDMTSYSDFDDKLEKLKAYTKMFNPNATDASLKHDLVNITYNNAVSGDPSRELLFSEASPERSGFSLFGTSTPTQQWEQLKVDLESFGEKSESDNFSLMRSFSNVVVGVGSLFANVEETAKSLAVVMIIPSMMIMVKVVLLGSLPVLFVLSGFNVKFLYNWILLYFSVSLVPYWVNVGLQLETILLSMADYNESISKHISNLTDLTLEGSNLYLISATASTFVYMLPVLWVVLVQMVGNVAGSIFMNLVAGAAIAGQAGAQATQQTLVNTGSKASNRVDNYFKNKGDSDFQASSQSPNATQTGNNPALGNSSTKVIGN